MHDDDRKQDACRNIDRSDIFRFDRLLTEWGQTSTVECQFYISISKDQQSIDVFITEIFLQANMIFICEEILIEILFI